MVWNAVDIKISGARKNRVAAGAENIGDGVGWGQCTQLKAGPRADAPTSPKI